MIIATHQYLTFKLEDEIYAIDVAHAREIVELPRLTRMPNAPPWIRGVMNLRGSVIPVIDLKHKFAMGATAVSAESCVLVVEFMFEDAIFVIGVLVDAVLAVFELEPQEVEEPPKFGARYSRRYLKGMGRRDNRVFMILAADEVFADVDLELAAPEASDLELSVSDAEAEPAQLPNAI
jgi:purine-binding chemotaxis protein CheW